MCCLKGVKFLSSFEREPGIALEVLQEKMSSTCVDRGISWFVSSCGWRLEIPLQVPQGTQGETHVASGKSSLHSSFEGERGSALESPQGIMPQFSWKGESQGVSRVVSCGRKGGFPRVATGT